MHVLLATLRMTGSIEDLKPILRGYSDSLSAFPGYVDHFWLQNRGELGLFHIFEDQLSLQKYSNSTMLAMLAAHPVCDGRVYARQFQLLSDVKRYTLQEAADADMDSTVYVEPSQLLARGVPGF